jgi:hypothetical protein
MYHFGTWTPSGYLNSKPPAGSFEGMLTGTNGYNFIQIYSHKPFVAAEIGCSIGLAYQTTSGSWAAMSNSDVTSRVSFKQEFWRQAIVAAAKYPNIKALIFFDLIKNEGEPLTTRDFSITGGPPGINSALGGDGSGLNGPVREALLTDLNTTQYGASTQWA